MNRTKIDIFAEILKKTSMPALKTHIMCSANLSYQQATDYIALLQDFGFLAHNVDDATFSTTEKGKQYVDNYDQLSEMFIAPAQVCV